MLKPVLAGTLALAAVLGAQSLHRPLTLSQTRYTAKAGESVPVVMPAESLAFGLSTKARTAKASGPVIRDFAIAPTVKQDAIALGVPLTTTPGEYSVEISLGTPGGEQRTATLRVTVEPFATPELASGSEPPVVLLDGWQFDLRSSCPIPISQNGQPESSATFGSLQTLLGGSPNNAPAVYFFENCTECPNCTIEQLGTDLGNFLNTLPYSQVDVVAHSMGGLIVRSYLAGKQTAPGVFGPPASPKVRKAVFVATPHFGAFAADFAVADILFAAGTQTNELKPASQFMWDLGTWNQNGDDLRGVSAISIVGNAGPYQQSDGVVETTSASLDFSIRGQTRVVDYCHIPPSSFGGLAGGYLGCTAPGIANVDSISHQTYGIVSSFLSGGTGWQGIGNSPAQDSYLSKYGGMVVADLNSADQFLVPSYAFWGTSACSTAANGCVQLTGGGASELFHSDFVSGIRPLSGADNSAYPFQPGSPSRCRNPGCHCDQNQSTLDLTLCQVQQGPHFGVLLRIYRQKQENNPAAPFPD